jgi:hypothetical protein
MTVLVQLTGGIQLEVTGDFEELSQGLRDALAKDKVLIVHLPEGKNAALNPQHVLYLWPVDPTPSSEAERAAQAAVPAGSGA